MLGARAAESESATLLPALVQVGMQMEKSRLLLGAAPLGLPSASMLVR